MQCPSPKNKRKYLEGADPQLKIDFGFSKSK